MGCSMSSPVTEPQRCAADHSTVVAWNLEYKEHSIDFSESLRSFRSMEDVPPKRSFHHGHVAKLERFLRHIDGIEIELQKAVEKKRLDHLVRTYDRNW
eukprot:Skav234505  [mRNA]  locus=scaffold1613:126006:129190:- [translate_table: standard]